MEILKHKDRMLLAQLLEKLPGLSDTAERLTVMIELGLDPNQFTIDQGSVHAFAVRFVYELNRQGHNEALQTMVTMLSDRLEGYKDDLARLKEVLEILSTDEKEEITEEREGNREGKSEVQAAIAEFKGVLHTVRGQIDGVCTYKELHEHLHNLQFLHNVIVDAAKSFPRDKTDQDSLKECDIRLEGMVADLQEVVQQPLLASENAWIQTLSQAQKELHDAIKHAKAVQLKRAIRSIDQELAIRPSLINRSLTTAARQLSMTALDDAMAHLAPEQAQQLENKVAELVVLNHELIALIDEHATWQEVDIVLRRIAGNMQEILDEIELSWPDLKLKTEPLYRNGTGDWAQQFREESERLEHSLTIKDPNNVRSSFRSYRSRAEVRFFAVDKKLKDQCTSMSKIGTQLLGMMQ